MFDRAQVIHSAFSERVRAQDFPTSDISLRLSDVGLTGPELVDLFESQVMSRHLDFVSRRLKGESFYTIGSAGHEGNAVLGKVFRVSDMAFLHYRSGALLVQRNKQIPGSTPLYDMMLSFVASSEDPVSGGRHKVLGGKDTLVPPQTSTIASHLPKAVGAAHSIGTARKLNKIDAVMPHDAIILCNFGDASANHSTTQGAINTACWTSYQNSPMPIVFICEDNGIGISVRTPKGWVAANFANRPGLEYMACDGLNLLDTHHAASKAVAFARQKRKPVFLHMRTVRLMGHAGSDVEANYRDQKQIEATEAQDPLLHTARILVENEILNPSEIVDLYEEIETRVTRVAQQAITRPKLTTPEAVMASIIPPRRDLPASAPASHQARTKLFQKEQRLLEQPQHLARQINLALADIMLQYEDTSVFGEDVGAKGGVYSATTGLQKKFGPARVIDTLLDEQSILGLAIGLAHNGFIPIPEIQFLAYVHNAEDQIRGEAATLPFFSDGQFTNPMLIRIAGLAYQKGFGGHFHNDNSISVFRDIPGIIVACPSNGADAAEMLRTCIRLVRDEQRVVVFIEPIALYFTADLHKEGDNEWLSVYTPPSDTEEIPFGVPGFYGDGKNLCIVTYGNGYYLSRKAAKILSDQHNVQARIVDLRWLSPIDEQQILNAVNSCDAVLVVDECRRTGSVSEQLMTLFVENDIATAVSRVTAYDSFIPLGAAAYQVLPSVEGIVERALLLTGSTSSNIVRIGAE